MFTTPQWKLYWFLVTCEILFQCIVLKGLHPHLLVVFSFSTVVLNWIIVFRLLFKNGKFRWSSPLPAARARLAPRR